METKTEVMPETKSETKLIEIKNLYKNFSSATILDDISLYVKKNEFITLLGPSGCGKTTTLRIIAGFETPTSGEVLFDGKDVLNVPAHKRKVNTVFQKYALFPNMNVYENIAFGLTIKKMDKATIDEKVTKMLKLVNLSGFEKRSIKALSGGQQQRVAIARALVNEPEVLLLDEPLGALDLKLRKEMQIELKNMQVQLGITFIYVTHDQEEALTMSDTVVVMNNGKIQQIGTAEDIYNEPKNAFVADFIGESNILTGTMIDDYKVEFIGQSFECVDFGFEKNEEVDVVIRPEDIEILNVGEGQFPAKVTQVTFKGVHYDIHLETPTFTFKSNLTWAPNVGDDVSVSIKPDLIHIMKKTTNK